MARPGCGLSRPSCQAVGLDFFGSIVAAYRAGQLRQRDAQRFVTGFLEAKAKLVSSRPKRHTGQCGHGLQTPPIWLVTPWGAPETQTPLPGPP